MFSSAGYGAAKAYRQVSAHSQVESASPHQLIQMLFDGLFQALNAARGAMARGEVEEKGRHISKSVRILQEGLVMGLDLEKGGELAANLKLLYDYSVAQLTKANIHNDVALVEDVIKVLQPVAQGWKEIGTAANPLM
ncbi:flagellar export chaperone FliS [Comamonas aquatica]|uniref:flagellar export chaperone FliS n=1 Tax=Comamonas aquatica TaxID=225991 RepID=UPI0024485992|nr:flagellar export chaperone FliS [Comamonas aquatica]MDH1674359.1 flagellar export chaperone FliS [Comamonas aquatica]MDH1677911.1 flagellar export chaperone FliS [Comamonas aquatica]